MKTDQRPRDAAWFMDQVCLIVGLLLLLGLAFFALSVQAAEPGGLRLEATAGKCRYGKAQDGTWYKNNYQQDLQLSTDCYSVGFSQTPFETPWGRLGWRAAYVDFGTARADTFVPVRDDEANSFPSGQNCNQQTFSGCVGQYKQWGRARGISFGPVLEKGTDYGTVGIEGGVYRYTSYWRVQGIAPGPGTCPTCGAPDTFDWNGAKGVHWTWYAGLTYELKGWFIQARRYHATYASQAKLNPQSIGLIAGPLYSVQVGYQFKF